MLYLLPAKCSALKVKTLSLSQGVRYGYPIRSLAALFSSHPPTEEQARVIESKGDIKVNAVAGSGKTATLLQYASRRPDQNILYLAFNKSVQKEAAGKFKSLDKNVDVKTAHSLAWNGIKQEFGGRIHTRGDYTPYEVKEIVQKQMAPAFNKMPSKIAEFKFGTHVLKYASLYCNSDATALSDIDYVATLNQKAEITFATKRIGPIIDATEAFLEKMGRGEISSIHDYYLKRYQLSKPELEYDVILFDEGQDASPAMLDVVLKQRASTVIVGDEHQQIYGFRHATNAMQKVDFQSLPMHTSFRFSPAVANLAFHILAMKKHLFPEFEPPPIRGMGKSTECSNHAILGRTNAALLTYAIENRGVTFDKPYFLGGFSNYSFGKSSSLYDVLYLFLGDHNKIRSETIKEFKDIKELHRFAEETEDLPLLGFIRVVSKYKRNLFSAMKELKASNVKSEKEADIILSTVHKAKGMEYDEVTLLSDFSASFVYSDLEKVGDNQREFYQEEINLLYVAATRTKSALNIPKSIVPRSWILKGNSEGINVYEP